MEASYHEVAPAQHQIDFRYGEALLTADNIMTFKLAVKDHCKALRASCHIYAETPVRA